MVTLKDKVIDAVELYVEGQILKCVIPTFHSFLHLNEKGVNAILFELIEKGTFLPTARSSATLNNVNSLHRDKLWTVLRCCQTEETSQNLS